MEEPKEKLERIAQSYGVGEYRRHLAEVYARRAIAAAMERAS